MARIKTTSEFEAWLRSLTHRARSKVLNRMRHMECGNVGDCRPVGNGGSESRIHYGPGYRLYFLRSGEAIHVLLLDGSKATQTADIRKAQAMAKKIKKGGAS